MDIINKKTIVILENISNVIDYQPADIQRLLDNKHVEYLVNDQIQEYSKYNQFSILQSITCADYENKRYILDGQHRISAFKKLRELNYSMNQYIPLIIYKTTSIEELKSYYIRINKHHPVNPLEVSELWFQYGKTFCVWFSKEFSQYVKNTETSCNCPNINLREMMEYIKRMKVFERLHNILNISDSNIIIKKLTDAIIEVNNYLIEYAVNISKFQLSSDFKKKLGKCLTKNNSHPCYLGIWRQFEWIELCVYILTNNKNIMDIDLSNFCIERKKINKSLRYDVWKKRNDFSMEGTCFVCNNVLHFENMECGHIIPHVYGGIISSNNLEPICKMCNRDMGVMNLNEYKYILFNNEKTL
jgi:hypothetical protein